MRPRGSPAELEFRRAHAIDLLQEGHRPVDVARMVGVDRRSVRRWKAAFRKQGVAGIRAKPAPGRPPRLSGQAKEELVKLLVEGPIARGFPTDLWTCPRVAKVIKERFGVVYHPDHVCRLLHSLGWSPQKPQRRAHERDEAAIQRWVHKDWVEVKKTPPE